MRAVARSKTNEKINFSPDYSISKMIIPATQNQNNADEPMPGIPAREFALNMIARKASRARRSM
jgi:hypothetical protein